MSSGKPIICAVLILTFLLISMPSAGDDIDPPMPSLVTLPQSVGSDFRSIVRIPRHMDRRDWQRFATGAATVGMLAVYDEDIRDAAMERRDDFYDDFKNLGDWRYATGFFLISHLFGRITKHRGLSETGAAGLEALVVTAVPTLLVQGVTGRERPKDGGSYRWFSFSDGHGASGHTATAFATATILDRRYLSVSKDMSGAPKWFRYTGKFLLYGAAVGTALERLNDDKHFASDVALGGTIGFLSANFVMNRREERRALKFVFDGETAALCIVKTF